MGFFDKLKGKIVTNEKIEEKPAKNESVETSKQEDLSSLTDLEVLKKIDVYVHEKDLNVTKVTCVVDEFEKRYNALPLEKRKEIAQSWSFLKVQVNNLYNPVIKMHPDAIISEISRYCTEIEFELS